MMDWDPVTATLSHSREISYQISALYNDREMLKSVLGQRPEAQIIRILTHDAKGSMIFIDGVPYIDEFGMHVYSISIVDWDGELTDIDERFAGTPYTPNDY